MIRLLTAAAMMALLASPVMAQSVSPSDQSGSGSSSTLQNQGSTTSPGSTSSESRGTLMPPSLSGQTPSDCTPNDARPECQTAQLPGQDNSSAVPGLSGKTTEPSGSAGSSGSIDSQKNPGSSSSPGTMGR